MTYEPTDDLMFDIQSAALQRMWDRYQTVKAAASRDDDPGLQLELQLLDAVVFLNEGGTVEILHNDSGGVIVWVSTPAEAP